MEIKSKKLKKLFDMVDGAEIGNQIFTRNLKAKFEIDWYKEVRIEDWKLFVDANEWVEIDKDFVIEELIKWFIAIYINDKNAKIGKAQQQLQGFTDKRK